MTDTEQLADVIALSVHLAIEPLIAENKALAVKVAALETRPVVQGRDGKDADLTLIADLRTELAAVRAELLAIKAWPTPKDGRDGASVTVADVAPLIVAEVTKAVAAIPAPRDGADGKSVSVEDIAPTIAAEVTKAVAAIPRPKDGRDGKDGAPGRDGADPDFEAIRGSVLDELEPKIVKEIEHAVKQLPLPKDGKAGQDGKSVTVDDLAPLIAAEVQQRVGELPRAKDGLGVTGALINRDGHLVLTFSDGTTNDVGMVIGKDGAAGLNGQDGAAGLAGKDGEPGLGFDDLDVAFDADKGWSLRFVRGEQVKEFPIPVPFDAGVWQSGRTYPKGAGVTVKGAFFIAQQRTSARPDDGSVESRAWRLSVKGGRDGKPGRDGRDLTERSDG